MDLDSIFVAATREMAQLLGVEKTQIVQYVPEQKFWRIVATYKQNSDLPDPIILEVPDADNPFAKKLKQLEIVRVDDTDIIEDDINKSIADSIPGAWLLLPLVIRNTIWGSFSLIHSQKPFAWSDEQVEIAQVMANQVAIAIQQANLYQQVQLELAERKRIEVSLRQAMQAAEAANLAKSNFLANMSHELRTPMNVILGFTQVMANDVTLTPTQQEDLQTIRRSGDHLLSLINDVLDLSKIEAGRSNLEETEVDLIALLHALRNMLFTQANSKGLWFQLDIAPEVHQFIITDEQKLRQILLNLLSNAIKFTLQGGIILRVNLQNPPAIEDITSIQILIFTIIDTGVGIAPTEQDIIFDAFIQGKVGKKSMGGTGLGLTISRKLLKLMGGEIFVESNLGKGSTFSFTLPVRPSIGNNISLTHSDRLVIGLAAGQSPPRILIADDRPDNRLLLVRLLTKLGLEIREAKNGQEAVKIWQEWHPDLIWMDIWMPILDGYEATQQIRGMEPGKSCIIIALSAQASQSDRELAIAAGCNDYISKPFREETLLVKMKEYLGLEYLYSEASSPIETKPTSTQGVNENLLAYIQQELASQPQAWLAKIEDAAICGEDQIITQLVNQLKNSQPQLATYLIQLANGYQFEQILKLIKQESGLRINTKMDSQN